MRTTLNIDDRLLERAAELTGEREKTSLVRMGLESLIALESSRRLARLGCSEPQLGPVSRRRSAGSGKAAGRGIAGHPGGDRKR